MDGIEGFKVWQPPLPAGVQEKLGILHGGVAYGVFAYEAHNPDELSFQEGDMVLVLRKGDDAERHWWWARLGDREGYLPRNLLGVTTPSSPLSTTLDWAGH